MAETLKILAQNAVATNGNVAVTAVPANKAWVVSSIVVAATSATPGNYTIYARINNEAVVVGNAVFYNLGLGAYETVVHSIGMTLQAGVVLHYYSASAPFTVHVFGSEVDV